MSEDIWAWAHEDRTAPEPSTDPTGVVAVLVAHNGGAWLARMLVSIAQLADRPAHLVAVDAGSTDHTGELLAKAHSEGLVNQLIRTETATGFGDAVRQALDELPDDIDPEWVWLLHDDVVVRRRALSELLLGGTADDRIGVVVPKLLLPKMRNYPDRIAEIGQSVTASGRRLASPGQNVDVGDLDQHQLDPTPVLGASTAGMLVRWECWCQLDGLDPDLPLYRDGVDLGWRANNAGWQVITAPNAALEHRQSGRWNERPEPLADPAVLDRRVAVRLIAAHHDTPARTALRLRAGSLLGAFGFLIGKDLDRMRGYWRAFRAGGHDAAIATHTHQRGLTAHVGARRSLPVGEPRTDAQLESAGLLISRGRAFVLGLQSLADAVSDRMHWFSRDSQTSIDELTSDEFDKQNRRHRFFTPTTLIAVLLVALTLISARHLGGLSALVGDRLPPAPSSLSEVWSAWWRPTPATPGTSAPWLLLMALGSTLTIGNPEIFVDLLIVASPALAFLTARRFTARLTDDRWRGVVIAGLWGLALPLLGITGSGSIGATLAGILLPAWATAVHTWFRRDAEGTEAWRAPAMAGLVSVVISSCYPIFTVATLAVAIVAVVRHRPWGPALFSVLTGWVATAGWWPFLIHNPGRLLTGTDPTYAPLGAKGGSVLPDFVPMWLVVIVFVAVWATACTRELIARTFDTARVASAGASMVSAICAVFVSRARIVVADTQVNPDPSLWLLMALGGMLAVLALPSPDEVTPLRAWGATLSLGALLVPMALWWAWGALSPLHRTSGPLPDYVVSAMDSQRHTRVMLVDLSGEQATWSIESGDQPSWGSGEHSPATASSSINAALTRVAQEIVQGVPADDMADQLTDAGVGYVWVRDGDANLASALASAGLTAAPIDATQTIWALPSLVSRGTVVKSGEQPVPVVEGRINATTDAQLVLAEPADSRWAATLNGHQLDPTSTANGQQAFELPNEAGQAEWHMKADWGWAVLQLVTIAAIVIMAAPSVKTSAPTARRAA